MQIDRRDRHRRSQRGEAATTRHANSQKEAKRRDFEQKETKEAKEIAAGTLFLVMASEPRAVGRP
jgi:hypothetical protein